MNNWALTCKRFLIFILFPQVRYTIFLIDAIHLFHGNNFLSNRLVPKGKSLNLPKLLIFFQASLPTSFAGALA